MNLLLLVPSLYMLQVYDRVLSTGNVNTLLMLWPVDYRKKVSDIQINPTLSADKFSM